MISDQEILFNFIYSMLYKNNYDPIDIDSLKDENKQVGEALNYLSDKLKELRAFSVDLASGNVDNAVASRDNPYTGPLKDLQANLRHLTWQTNQVAHGDYNQKVEFLGEFSDSFNTMVEMLKTREQLITENAEKEKELAEEKTRSLEQALNARSAHYEEVIAMNNEMRSFRHDVNNHLISISSLIENGKYAEAQEYISNITQTIKKSKTINTNNYILDSILVNKQAKAASFNIKYTVQIDIPPNLQVNNLDWAGLFGNILDNAIEAASQVKDNPYILIKLKHHANSLIGVVSNNYVGDKLQKDEEGNIITSKPDKANHGIGLLNIKKIITKYDGTLDISTDDNVFTLKFVLFNV